MLAVAIALWRANGYNIPGWGVFEYYRQLVTGTGIGAPTAAVAPNVTLRAPAGFSTLYTVTGQQVAVRADGTVAVSDEDAKPLIAAGWQRIERNETSEPEAAARCVA